jgi:pilus assembly protein FimV
VKPGETLGRIARTVKPDGASYEQTLVGLYRQNPDAFIRKNMNLVKSGRILKVPEANELASVQQREAAQEIRLQMADFNSFRGRIADRAAAAPEGGSVTSGKIGGRVADAQADQPRDTVRVSRGDPNAKGKAGTGERVRALEEEAVAREKALNDANARISSLEKTIKDMQRLAEMKGGAGAGGVQAPATKGGAPAPAGKAEAPAPATKAEAPPVRTDTVVGKGEAPPAKGEAPGPVAVAPVIPPPGSAP